MGRAGSGFALPMRWRLLSLGESIAINGCCLTVVSSDAETMSFDVGPETLARTTFGMLTKGSRANLERAVAVGERFGGHFVTGHIDTVGTIAAVESNGEWITLRIDIPSVYDDLLIEKGSIAVDGVSLTLASVEPGRVSIMVIPHTQSATTLGEKREGDARESRIGFDRQTRKKTVCHALPRDLTDMSESAPPDPPTMSTRQTLTFLQKIFKTYGLEAKSKLGQNFLVDLNLLDLIVRAGEVGKRMPFSKWGPDRIADIPTCGYRWLGGTVEIDQTLQPVAEQMCAGRFNISHVSGDCLERKSRLSSRMLEAWEAAVAKGFPTRKLIANLRTPSPHR